VRDWSQAAEDLGYASIEVPDHVFGAAPRDGWSPRYSDQDPFHEVFVMLGYLAGATTTIELTTGVLILPQRQTGLVAKQAAEVDILSGGRLRLGIGVGWNPVEYQALGMEWSHRGACQAEQVEVLRQLWTQDLVTYQGKFHDLRAVNITPLPVQRPIPVWFGGSSNAVIKRAARWGDGWMPIMNPGVPAEKKLALLRSELEYHGRDVAEFGLEAWLRVETPEPDAWASAAADWSKLGATRVLLYPMYRMTSLDEQIATLRRFKEVVAS
jgi:probable F420-dependent oxidoreductase